MHTRMVNRTVTELLAPATCSSRCAAGDDLVEREIGWRALRPTRFALLDDEFAERVLPWPQIAHALLRRGENRTDDLEVIRAISCQPRLEVRLVLLLWHLAARWGRVESAGSASGCRSRTGCWARWSARSARRSRMRWPGSRAPAWSRARRATGTCTARSTST